MKLFNETVPANHAGRELLMLALIRVKPDGLSGHAYGLWVNYKANTQDEVTRIESE